jgi:Lon protease-like protein
VELPLFPLSTVLYPGAPLPLHIFEERYREMFARVMDGERRFGVVAITSGRDVDPSPGYSSVGCVAHVREVRPYADGRMDVVAKGTARFRVRRVTQTAPYIMAEVAILEDTAGDSAGARAALVRDLYGRYTSVLLDLAGEEPDDADLPDDPVEASWLVAAGLQVDLPDRQRLLAISDAAERLLAETRLLRRELALLERLEAAGPAPMAGPFSLN